MAGATDVIVRFIGDASSIQNEATKVEGTGGKIKGWAKGIGAAIGAAFAVDQLKDFVKAASDLQDQTSATRQIFGGAAKGVENFASKADTAFGISRSGALGAANTFATFGKSAGLSGDQLGGFATGLTGLAGDLASFRGTSPEQAIEAIGAALRGETEPIRAYGVLLDDATLRNRAMAMGLTKTTKEALTPQQKVLAAQAEILAQTGDAQGDFTRTSDSAANQQKILAAQMENTQAALGTALLPVLSMVLPVLQMMAKFIQENAGWLVPLTAAVLGVAAAIWIWNAAMAANPIMLIVIGVAALVAGIILLWQNWDTVWSFILGLIQTVWGWIADHWPLLLTILTGPIGLAVALIVNYWDTIWGAIVAVFNWIRDVFVTVVQWIIAPFQWAWDFIKQIPGWITGLFWGVVDWFTNAFKVTEEKFLAPFKSAWEWIKGVPDMIMGGFWTVFAWFRDTFSGVKDLFLAPFKAAFNAIAKLWNNTVGRLSFSVPDWVPGIGGKGFDVPDIPEFARGGIVSGPTLALLGERGPEAVVPLGQLGGGTNVTIIVNAGPLGADAPSIQSAVVAALRGYTTRNGPLPSSMVG